MLSVRHAPWMALDMLCGDRRLACDPHICACTAYVNVLMTEETLCMMRLFMCCRCGKWCDEVKVRLSRHCMTCAPAFTCSACQGCLHKVCVSAAVHRHSTLSNTCDSQDASGLHLILAMMPMAMPLILLFSPLTPSAACQAMLRPQLRSSWPCFK